MQGVLTPVIELWSFGNPRGLPSPNFGSVSFILTLPQVGLRQQLVGTLILECAIKLGVWFKISFREKKLLKPKQR
jgi:hypothetical protein